jgi:hypothetical protein
MFIKYNNFNVHMYRVLGPIDFKVQKALKVKISINLLEVRLECILNYEGDGQQFHQD